MDDVEWNRLFRMHRTVLEMLADRGYAVDRQDLDTDYDTFRLSYGQSSELNGVFHHQDSSVPPIKIKFDLPNTKIDSKAIMALVHESKEDRIARFILICREEIMTPIAFKQIARLRVQGHHFEVFTEKEVLINITKHELVPRHRPLSAQEKEELLDRYKLKDSQLPKILMTDPVVKYFGVEPGTVMEITRRSETAGRYVTYRLVC
jgi:DNA-directed RNA polymerase I, II, and III subunit RPABC1